MPRGRTPIPAAERPLGGLLVVLLALLPSLGAVACDGEARPGGDDGRGGPTSTALRVTDDAGRTLSFDAPPRRIVSLVPATTEILLALGAADRIVGRTDFDTLPPVDTLPSVGEGLRPSVERIVALDPDLVVRFDAPSDPGTPGRLDDLGVPHVAVRPDGIDDVRRIVRLLGTIVDAAPRADSLIDAMDAELEAVAERVDTLPEKRVAFVLGGSPPWVAGPGTFIHELIELAGGRNVFDDLGELYGPVSPETFVSRGIDVVVVPEGESPELPVRDVPLRHAPAWMQTPGPDLGEAARTMAELLHPEAFR